ncbi:MAG: hypothetical protein M1840_002113 [Geoglossum simile]|nr:MAG: hypothetical protein M1840_002113 [Geoglossum simile]
MGTGGNVFTPLSLNGILLHEIMEEFRYPKQFAHSMLTNNGSYSRYIEHGYNTDGNLEPKSLCEPFEELMGRTVEYHRFPQIWKQPKLTLSRVSKALVLQTPNSPCLNFSFVMRIDLATNTASSLFFTRVLTDLTRSLESRGEEMQRSPLAFLNLLFEMHGSMTELYREKRDVEVCVAELQTGTSSLIHSDRITPADEMNNENLMKELHALNAKLLILDGVMNWELSAGKFIRETYTTLSELRALSTPQDQPLRDSLDYLLNLSSLRQTQAQTLQKRVQMQLGVLYSLISQRDNKLSMSIAKASKEIVSATRRDSSSMKTIAVLGLIYLPGTFVAVR